MYINLQNMLMKVFKFYMLFIDIDKTFILYFYHLP